MKTSKTAATKSNGGKRPGRKTNANGIRVQAPFRLSESVMVFLTRVATLGEASIGIVAENCLWAHLPKEQAKYAARRKLVGRKTN